MPFRLLFLTLAMTSVLLTGCRNRVYREPPRGCPPPMAIPPAGIPDGPPPPAPIPSIPPPKNGAELLLPEDPGRTRSEYPKRIPPARQGAELGEPDYADPPAKIEEETTPKEEPSPKAGDPSGIQDFADVKEGVSTGRRPTIDGLDWLRSSRYKMIVYIRQAKQDDTTDRRQVELRDMKYVSLLISPETLNQDWIDEFNRIVGDSAAQPVFIYGDTSVAGTVWYLHLRTAEFLTHEEARARARRYGNINEQSELYQAALKLAPPN